MDDGAAMFARAEKLNWEGILSKRADAPYRSGDRSDSWQKIKTSKRETFPSSATCRSWAASRRCTSPAARAPS
ncbi:ATPdependent DNA ligase EC 6511 [Bradyrhizobium sp.]|nr:ATPdependent DNA ligase EC 6511 [Bradyrhizobium sp.]